MTEPHFRARGVSRSLYRQVLLDATGSDIPFIPLPHFLPDAFWAGFLRNMSMWNR